MIISFGNNSTIPQISKEMDIKNTIESSSKIDSNQKLQTDSNVKIEQTSKDSVEINSVKPENKDGLQKDKTNSDSEVKDIKESKSHNNQTDIKTKTLKDRLGFLNKVLPKKNEQISAKTLLAVSSLASGVALVVGLFNKSIIRTIGMIAAFFTPYLLTKSLELINEQNTAKKD